MRQKSKLTREEVIHVAKLARLTLASEEIDKFRDQLSEVLNYVEILGKVDTAGVSPTSQITGLKNVFRDDEVSGSLLQEEALSGTKNKDKKMFKTKAIFE